MGSRVGKTRYESLIWLELFQLAGKGVDNGQTA
jgi:hypothetical protein